MPVGQLKHLLLIVGWVVLSARQVCHTIKQDRRQVHPPSYVLLLNILVLPVCIEAQAVPPQQLVTIGNPSGEATLLACDLNGIFQFRLGEETRRIKQDNLVRWSNPTVDLQKSELMLTDGSRIAVAQSWSGQSSVLIETEKVSVSTILTGKVEVLRNQVQAILLNSPTDFLQRTQLLDQLLALAGDQDRLLLTNGDVLVGQLLRTKSERVDGKNRTSIGFKMDDASTTIAADRIAGITFNDISTNDISTISQFRLAVGLSDGSLLMADDLQVGPEGYAIKLASGIKLTGTDREDIVYLQSHSKPVYLSDLEVADYLHQPYLEIPWSYRQDRNLNGGPIQVDDRIYPKAIAMHSTSRLTYEIPDVENEKAELRHKRFAAEVAIDDQAEGGGSVIFRVLLRLGEDWQTAFTSPVIRGEDPPLAVIVELGAANQIALVAEYADRGDERDHAAWLDARFE